jgi:REP element-mobilizing transposase RayT
VGRDLRAIDPDHRYHVVSKGNNGEPIVRDGIDYELFCRDLDRVATKYLWKVWAWVLMPNHFHLVLETLPGALSAGMRDLNGNNGRRMNRRHGREGHLVKNRFFSLMLESEAHEIAAVAYVARNPVKAGLCRNAADWPYGSFRGTLGLDPAPPWLAVSTVLDRFDPRGEFARRWYWQMVHSGHLPVSDTIEEVSRIEPPLVRAGRTAA